MGTAKVRSLVARPSKSALLSFEVDGIVWAMIAELGSTVTAFDFTSFYAGLGETFPGSPGSQGVPPDPSRLLFDSTGMVDSASVQASFLGALRAETAKAALDSAVAGRQNAYYTKYSNQSAIIAQMRQYYDASVGGVTSKPSRLSQLAANANTQANELDRAYAADGITGVVKTTASTLTSTVSSSGSSDTSSNGTVGGTNGTHTNSQGTTNQLTLDNPTISGLNGNLVVTQELALVHLDGTSYTLNAPVPTSQSLTSAAPTAATSSSTTDSTVNLNQTTTATSKTTSAGTSDQVQTTVNADYAYRFPAAESQAQFERVQISLIDEQFSQFMASQNLPHLETVFTNELQAIDLTVKRLQVAYLNTILLSPISGVVSSVCKNPGDYVQAGEPVVRVDNNDSVYLVGTLIYRGLVSIGSSVTVTTLLFDGSTSTTLTGTVVFARGHKSEDDQWDVVVSCSNLAAGSHILPIHYRFDFDDTTVVIS